MRGDERGVSDVIGFVLVFGLVVLSIGLIYTVGFGALQDVQRAEAIENADRAFDIVAANLDEINRNGAPGRNTELQFAGGQVALTGEVTVVVNVTGGGRSAIVPIDPISYERGESGLYYTAGAVVRRDRDASVVVNEPPFRFGEERTVISLVQTTAAGETASVGGGSVRVNARREGARVIVANTSGVTYFFNVTSPRYRAWDRYLSRRGLDCSTDASVNTVICEGTTDALYVRQTSVRVALFP